MNIVCTRQILDDRATAAYRHRVLALDGIFRDTVHNSMAVIMANTHPRIVATEGDAKGQGVTAVINGHQLSASLSVERQALAVLINTHQVLPIGTDSNGDDPSPLLRALLRPIEREIPCL